MHSGDPSSLESQILELRARLSHLEDALRTYGIEVGPIHPAAPEPPQPAPAPAQPPAPTPQSIPWADALPAVQDAAAGEAATQTPPQFAPPTFAFATPSIREDSRSLESRIGSQWFNRIGILAILIAAAWFLKLAIDNRWIGPLGRIAIGLVAGAGFIAWSERFRSRGYTAFSYSLKAVGTGILYLSLWAAFSLYHLIPASAAFLAMIAVTAFNGFLAWILDAELLALYAIVGGICTPLLVSTGENHEIALFSYALMLDLAMLVLVALRPWSRLIVAAFAGTVVFFAGWSSAFYSDNQMARTCFFLALFFLIFAFAPRLVRLHSDDSSHPSPWDPLTLVLLPAANAALAFGGFAAMMEISGTTWPEPWIAVLFAAFYLLLLRLPSRGALHSSPNLLSSIHLATAIVFLTIAIPLKAHGRWLTVGWLVEGAALLWASTQTRSRLLRVLSLLCIALGLVALLTVNPPASAAVVFNQRFGTYCVAIAVVAFAAWLLRASPSETPGDASPTGPSLSAVAILILNLLILIAIGLEIDSFWWHRQWTGNRGLLDRYRMYAQFTYSAFFMIFGAILLAIGFARRSAFLRWQALFLLAITIGKVFLVDISALSQQFRILSFLGLGALLLAVSFVYQRDWLNLRTQKGVAQ